MNPVILIRHAQSQWNAENRFTGWADPKLTEKGMDEARQAGEFLRNTGYTFDTIYSSVLLRALQTAQVIQQSLGLDSPVVQQDWRLNERHYGALQGLNKQAMAEKVGEDQVWRWRRAYLEYPPTMTDEAFEVQKKVSALSVVPHHRLPRSENLADTRARVSGFWEDVIQPVLGTQKILISAHGNTIRALIMELSQMSEQDVEKFEIPTGEPIALEFDSNKHLTTCHYLRGNQKSLLAS